MTKSINLPKKTYIKDEPKKHFFLNGLRNYSNFNSDSQRYHLNPLISLGILIKIYFKKNMLKVEKKNPKNSITVWKRLSVQQHQNGGQLHLVSILQAQPEGIQD